MVRFRLLSITLACAVGFALVGCDGSQPEPQADGNGAPSAGEAIEGLGEQIGQVGRKIDEAMNESKQQFTETAQNQLDKLNGAMERLGQQAQEKGSEAQDAFRPLKETFDKNLAEARTQLDQVKEAGVEQWKGLARGFKNAAQDMREAYDQARQRVNDAAQPTDTG